MFSGAFVERSTDLAVREPREREQVRVQVHAELGEHEHVQLQRGHGLARARDVLADADGPVTIRQSNTQQ